ILAFTAGEMFFPMHVEGYIELCSLDARTPAGIDEEVCPAGSLTAEQLIEVANTQAPRSLALRFVQEPLGGLEYQVWHSRRPKFSARGRLARVGLFGRLTDALLRLSILARGRVPGGTTAAAQQQYEAIRHDDPDFVYHGRVTREGEYTVLNYQFFYAMNDWRSSFFGVNDHEADWEQVFVYLVESKDGALQPAWLAYASHDFSGADLRRRWDDPDLTIVDDHPVVYTAAGSHASYFYPGEYVTSVELSFLRPVAALTGAIARFWRNSLGQGDPREAVRHVRELISVPFVDYARGDGVSVGPGQAREWTPVVIDDSVPWVDAYRGLWGLDTRDILAGELAPAGPKYNRDGSVRRTWYDPIGWAALDQEPSVSQSDAQLAGTIERLEARSREAAAAAKLMRDELPELSLQIEALSGDGAPRSLLRNRQSRLDELAGELRRLTAEAEELRAETEACRLLQQRIRAGYRPGPKDHLRYDLKPEPAQTFREGRIAELWAAASIGVLLLLTSGL
ncbi:MAG TPA: hypothetical protein VG845_02770, partial [Dehalococcoidia bacterium]|nr:hypothetical protein [Dehalococcoidia bacterium]